MLRRLFARASTVMVGALALVLVISGSAYAGNTAEYVTVGGINRGLMTHLDNEPDTFEVCDVNADGYGVTGYLYHRTSADRAWRLVDSEDDGGDAGCDYFPHEIKENLFGFDDYQLLICWRSWCESDNFHE